MRKVLAVLFFVTMFVVMIPKGTAQDKPKTTDVKPAPVTLKVDVTFTDYEGEKKIKSLPYSLLIRASEGQPWGKMRVGSRVPVYVGKDGGMQYIDVGTNIDSHGNSTEDGRFNISLTLERSWVEGEVSLPIAETSTQTTLQTTAFKEPIIRQFRTDLTLNLRDGESTQSIFATDPLSGRVITVTVMATVVK